MSEEANVQIDASEVRPDWLLARRVAILGYGNQGRAHVLNLRDQGVSVVVGARAGGKAHERATEDGFAPKSLSEATSGAEVVMLTLPDGAMPEVYRAEVEPHLLPGGLLLFAHGFNIVFEQIQARSDVDVALVSPKAAGYGVRLAFEQGKGVPALVAVHQDVTGSAWLGAVSYAWGIGCARSLMLRTTFREETVTDLFGEQTVLCGGIPELIRAGFETLVAAGYSPEIAYFECLHETKLIVDLLVAKGLAGMHEAISDTASWGGLTVGPQIIDESLRNRMKESLEAIESGDFAQGWVSEQRAGRTKHRAAIQELAGTEVEQVGKTLRPKI